MRAQGVAEETGLRPATIYTHVRNVVSKLGVDTRTQAVAIATRYAFLDPGEGARAATPPKR
jgi:DNA-binding NarL/FixJ family response regulator